MRWLLAWLVCTPALAQTTWYVDVVGIAPGAGTQVDPYTSIQYALDQASTVNGDTVLVAPGVYFENLTVPAKSLRIEGTGGPAVTRIEASGPGHLLAMPNSSLVTLVGFTLSGAHGGGAAGIAVLGNPATVFAERCIVTGNDIGLLSRYDLIITQSTIAGNDLAALTEGFAIPTLQATNCVFWDNPSGYSILSSFGSFQAYCLGDISNMIAITGSVQIDPELWDAAVGDYRPRPGSPVIDAGDPNSPNDADGSPADVGALVYDPNYATQPTTYCTPKVASDGCVALIGYQGVGPAAVPALSSTDEFLVTSDGVSEFRNGLFYFGLAPSAFPFQGGWFCIQPPTARTLVQNSGTGGSPCTGTFSIDINALFQSGAFPFVGAGSSVYGQYWFRDPSDPFGSVRTNAITFGLAE